MKNLLSRALTALVAVLCAVSLIPSAASADTGPWQWTDISDKLSARDNRPVWAIARAEPYWYLTDGQELWSGGHVWKTDGSIMNDITVDVRNAGLSRVDDIVSDGQTALFLKDIARRDNQFQILSYNGSFTDRTSLLRGYLNSNEGITSITGNNGTWMIVTSQNRVFNWNMGSSYLTQVSLPITASNGYNQPYSVRHVSPADGQSVFYATQVVPTSGGWIFAIPQGGNGVKVYNYQNGNFNQLSISDLYDLRFIVSNGSQVYLSGYNFSCGPGLDCNSVNNAHIWSINGSNYTYLSPVLNSNLQNSLNKAIAAYNGKSWMILVGKNLLRFDGTNFQSYGETRDYFVQTIGNGNGTFLLGGAVSSLGSSSPTSPLTAKLVRADEGTGYVTPSVAPTYTQNNEKVGTVNGMKNRITYWAWLNPNFRYQASNTKPTYTVGAQSNDGIKKIELYINDVYQKTCLPGNTKKNTTCSMTIDPAAWQTVSNVGSFAKITSGANRVAYVPASIISFYDANVSANMTVDNNTPYLVRGTTNNATVTGYAGTGLNRIDIYVNGSVQKTCSLSGNSGSCTLGLNGNDYNLGSAVSFNGRAVASNGQEAWTWLGTYTVTDYNYNSNSNNNNYTGTNGNLSAWVWTEPTGSDFSSSDKKTIKAQANAGDGLQKIEIIVNGQSKQTCNFSRAYGTQNCQVDIYGSNYSNSTQIPVYVRATDYNSRQATSQTLYLNTNYNNSSNSLSTWFDTTGSSNLGYNETRSVTFYGTSVNGLRQLDLYANDNLVGTCTYSDVANSTQSCTRSIYASNYSQGTYVTLKSKATDRYGYTVWSTNNPQLYVTNNSSNNNNNNGNASVSLSTTDNRTSYGLNETFTLNAYANDPDGIRRIDLYANNVLVNTCTLSNSTYGNCSSNVIGSNYTSGSMSLPLQAKVTDSSYNTFWSDIKNVQIGSGNNNNSYNTTVTISLSPNQTSFQRNQSFTVSANAYDGNGIQKMEIYVNNSLAQTCNSSYNTSATCSTSVTGSNYSNVTSLPIQVKVTDNNSNVVWSDTTYVQLTDNYNNNSQGNNQINVPGTLSVNSSADNGYTSGQNITFTANGADDNGIQRIELYVNGDVVQTCNGSGTCSYTGGPYSASSLTYGAKLIDNLGNSTWNGYKTIYKK
ncbi:MAG: Ig-like domain-containing protein [Patescibacteria group bacterium]|nr:Ig-like domain-containing protein [Patescibacteria group bacterium]